MHCLDLKPGEILYGRAGPQVNLNTSRRDGSSQTSIRNTRPHEELTSASFVH